MKLDWFLLIGTKDFSIPAWSGLILYWTLMKHSFLPYTFKKHSVFHFRSSLFNKLKNNDVSKQVIFSGSKSDTFILEYLFY